MKNSITLKIIKEAAERIAPYIHKTPVLTSQSINSIANAALFFKCENFQKVGAFKIRGAANAVLSLNEEEKFYGVCTHSSGNFAQALALSAKKAGIKAYIVMPRTAPAVKKNAVLGYGAEVILCEPTLEEREKTLAEVVKKHGAVFIHPYNDYRVIAGHASIVLEILGPPPLPRWLAQSATGGLSPKGTGVPYTQGFGDGTLSPMERQISGGHLNETERMRVGPLDFIISPVGGGGLISGIALATHYLSPQTIVIGAEPEGAADAARSLKTGKIQPSINPKTIADGLLTSLGDKTYPIIQKYVKEIINVSEEEIISAMKLIWERMKIIVEPSSSVTLAAVLKEKEKFRDKRVGIILSGGNVDIPAAIKLMYPE